MGGWEITGGILKMLSLDAFKTRLSRLSAVKDIPDDLLTDFVDTGLLALSEWRPEQVLLKKVPVDSDAGGIYAVPSDALSVLSVLVHGTDTEIHFEVERDATTNARELHVGAIKRPQWLFVAGPVMEANYGVDESTFTRTGRLGGVGGYDFFDILYSRKPTIERLTAADLAILQLYVEYLSYDHRSGVPNHLVDIRDRDPSGDETEIKQSGLGKQFMRLAQMKKDEFDARVISPYAVRDTMGPAGVLLWGWVRYHLNLLRNPRFAGSLRGIPF